MKNFWLGMMIGHASADAHSNEPSEPLTTEEKAAIAGSAISITKQIIYTIAPVLIIILVMSIIRYHESEIVELVNKINPFTK